MWDFTHNLKEASREDEKQFNEFCTEEIKRAVDAMFKEGLKYNMTWRQALRIIKGSVVAMAGAIVWYGKEQEK